MPTEQELFGRLAARAEALDYLVARLSQDDLDSFIALLEEQSRISGIAASAAKGPTTVTLPAGTPSETIQGWANTLRHLSDNAETYREQAIEFEFLALLFRHRDVAIDWDSAQVDANGFAVFCVKCAKPGETLAPLCFTCATDRFLIMRCRPS